MYLVGGIVQSTGTYTSFITFLVYVVQYVVTLQNCGFIFPHFNITPFVRAILIVILIISLIATIAYQRPDVPLSQIDASYPVSLNPPRDYFQCMFIFEGKREERDNKKEYLLSNLAAEIPHVGAMMLVSFPNDKFHSNFEENKWYDKKATKRRKH